MSFDAPIRPGACPECWRRGKAVPLIGGRCFQCVRISPENPAPEPVVDIEIEDVEVDVDI